MGSAVTESGPKDAGVTDSDSAMQPLVGPSGAELLALRFDLASPSWI